MAANTNTNLTFDADLARAREAYNTLKRVKGQRQAAVRAFLDATTHEGREDAVQEHGAGFTRRGLREAAVFFEGHGNQDVADVFWALRDDIDMDGEVFHVESVSDVA
jgi:hypothetical protein